MHGLRPSGLTPSGAHRARHPSAVPSRAASAGRHPPLAHLALTAAPDIGLLLPCSVIVRDDSHGRLVVGFLDPQIMVNLVGRPKVRAVADAAEQRLHRACESLGGSATQST